MNVKMPDGTIVENVPEGTTKAELMVKLHAARNPLPKPEPTGMGERFLQGMADPIVGAAQLADKAIDPIRQAISPGAYSMNDVVRRRDADYQAPEGVDVARIAGNIANPISWYGGGGTAATKAGAAVAARLPAALKTATATAAGAGALQSALAPTEADLSLGDFAAEKAKQATIGGVSAGVMQKVLPTVLKASTPIKPTENAAKLQRQGITLTPGQAAGGALNDLEQKATSWPVVGEIIKGARARSLDDFQQKAIERATGKAVKTLDEADAAVSSLYQQVVPKLKPTKLAAIEVSEALARAGDNPELTEGNRKILEGLHDKLFGPGSNRYMQLSGDSLKDLDTELGALARKYGKSVLPSDQTLGSEIYNIRQAMRNAWSYHLDPADVGKLHVANDAYRKLVPIHQAASQRADELVMPRALQKAMAKQANKEPSRFSDELVSPAVDVLRSTVPDSGTAGRLTLPGAILAGQADLGSTLAGIAATAGAYSRKGSNVLTGNTKAQRWVQQNAEKKLTPAARKAFLAAIRAQQADNSQE